MHTKRYPLYILLFLLAAIVPSRADKIDDYIRAEMEKQHIPGLSLAVIKDGKIIKVEGYGLANLELNIPVKPDTIYKIGSISKQFIATGIMLLVEEGKLSLEDKISKYLEGTPETWKEITVRHLLTHTSGIIREAPGFDIFKVQADADVIKTAYPGALRFAPGEKWEYCNVGYFALAEIITRVSGKLWADFINERVFMPVGMSVTRTTTMKEIIANRADSYDWENNKHHNAVEFLALRPSGAFISNVLDLAKWDAALYTDKILKQSSRDQMWTPVTLNNGQSHPYGLGWNINPVNGHKIMRHGGTLSGFRSEFARFVDDGLTIIVLTNCRDAKPQSIALGVAAFYLSDIGRPSN
jgi:D-alanyl-D-alanine carboxypeptidase